MDRNVILTRILSLMYLIRESGRRAGISATPKLLLDRRDASSPQHSSPVLPAQLLVAVFGLFPRVIRQHTSADIPKTKGRCQICE
jgi:hypothetical protein